MSVLIMIATGIGFIIMGLFALCTIYLIIDAIFLDALRFRVLSLEQKVRNLETVCEKLPQPEAKIEYRDNL